MVTPRLWQAFVVTRVGTRFHTSQFPSLYAFPTSDEFRMPSRGRLRRVSWSASGPLRATGRLRTHTGINAAVAIVRPEGSMSWPAPLDLPLLEVAQVISWQMEGQLEQDDDVDVLITFDFEDSER